MLHKWEKRLMRYDKSLSFVSFLTWRFKKIILKEILKRERENKTRENDLQHDEISYRTVWSVSF